LDTKKHNHTVETVFERLSNLKIYPPEALTPYEEFRVGSKTYYFTPGGSLYRREPRMEEIGGLFCGYLTDEVWHRRTDG